MVRCKGEKTRIEWGIYVGKSSFRKSVHSDTHCVGVRGDHSKILTREVKYGRIYDNDVDVSHVTRNHG